MSAPQPAPEHVPGAQSVHVLVARDALRFGWEYAIGMLDDRYRAGMATYGVELTVAESRRDAVRDLIEELADGTVYAYRVWKRGARWARPVYWVLLGLTEYVGRRWDRG